MAAHIPQSHGDENQSEKKKTSHSSHRRCVTASLSFFLCVSSRFTSEFYFETGNTKLPETAQFTQAPQSTTAFKLS